MTDLLETGALQLPGSIERQFSAAGRDDRLMSAVTPWMAHSRQLACTKPVNEGTDQGRHFACM